MKVLIVNADDLGASPGITRGILEAHTRGIVTSASLMVDTPWSTAAADLTRSVPRLSVGLHVVLDAGADRTTPSGHGVDPGAALHAQHARFVALMGRAPTHVDSHHNAHRDPRLLPSFLEFSRAVGLPLRGHSPARYFSSYYGRWGGESHPEQVSVETLARMLEREIGEGITELSCHPGYVDPLAPSDYSAEREVELDTLCDPRARAALVAHGITLASYHDFDRLVSIGLPG